MGYTNSQKLIKQKNNNMKKTSFLILVLCSLLFSCSNLSEKEIEETTSSGVVLVQNQSYYEVVLSNGESIYFSNFDEDGDLKGIATEEDSVEVVTNYGTGFFVSETGEIATNAHVVSNMVADKEVNNESCSSIQIAPIAHVQITNNTFGLFRRIKVSFNLRLIIQ